MPVDATEEDTLYEYLNLLVSRPDLRRSLGQSAKAWVERECNWDSVAERYVAFLKAVVDGQRLAACPAEVRAPAARGSRQPSATIEPEYVAGWAETEDARKYIRTHITRLAKTLEITPPGSEDKRILEMGSYLQITPALKTKLGYGEVRGCYYGELGTYRSASPCSPTTARRSSARSITSMPRRIASRIRTSTSPRCSAAS